MSFPILSILIFLPLAGAGIIGLLPSDRHEQIKRLALLFSLVTFILSVPLFFIFDPNTWELQFVEKYPWVASYGMTYHLGIDGISLLLLLMTTFLSPLVVLSTWTAIERSVKGCMVSLMLLETGMIGTFCAMDYMLFYVFWELMLIPMYLIIGIWGGERRIYSAVKYFVYTMLGSVLMLVAILYIYFQAHAATGEFSFSIQNSYGLNLNTNVQYWVFGAFALAFAIKVPLFPFHTWLPDAHVEAPTAGSVILAGVLLKMGTYGFARFCLPLFPVAAIDFTEFIRVIAVIGIIYGALVALVQEDIKKLVAYSSISHLGFVMLGLFSFNPEGVQGSLLQMVNHGLSTGALFLMVGMLYERRHTRLIRDYGGLYHRMPVYAFLFLIVSFSSIGVPGLNGFVGELLIMIGAYKAHLPSAIGGTLGLILGPVYLLWMYKRVMLGKLDNDDNRRIPDVRLREFAYIVPIVVMMFWIGLFPRPFIRVTTASVTHLLESVTAHSGSPMLCEKAIGIDLP